MAWRATAVVLAAVCAAWPASAVGRSYTQTLVFDAVATGSFVDKPPAGPSPGDIEHSTAKLLDAQGHVVGTTRSTCVFTKKTRDDMLERCSDSAKTAEGTVTLAGVGHLYSMNPPWRVTGRSGAYKGVHGTQVFATDIPLDPNVPLAAGRAFSVVVITAKVTRPLKLGVVARPAENAGFIRRANAACHATDKKAEALGGFPFSDFDPFNPDPQLLPQVGQFFNQPARRDLPSALLQKLKGLGKPPASRTRWKRVLDARQTQIGNESSQISAALANNAPQFVKSVYQLSRDYNQLVLASAAFGVQACTFG